MTAAVTHLVLTRWKADAPADLAETLARHLDDLVVAMPEITRLQHGPSVSPEQLESGFEWCLLIDFVDRAGRDAYLPHPAHDPIKRLIGDWAEQLVVFDLQG